MAGAVSMVVGIVVAGGSGERFGRPGGKQLLGIAGRPVVSYSVEAVGAASAVSAVVVVCHPDRVAEYREAIAETISCMDVPLTFVPGGATRQESVERGLAAAEHLGAEVVVVHDGARPLLPSALVDESCAVLLGDEGLDGVVVGHPVTDTLKIAQDDRIESTPDRSRYWAVQTPQIFRTAALRSAMDHAAATGFLGTDDASLVEHHGGRVRLVCGPRDNLKITIAEDAAIAEAILAWKAAGR